MRTIRGTGAFDSFSERFRLKAIGMTLKINKRAQIGTNPGVHVLIAGTSLYRHLPNGGDAPAARNFGMQQLASPALSAYKIYRWLEERQDKLALPLTTCRLLLSPSVGEIAVEPQLAGLAEACTRQNFIREAQSWRTDASTHDENITIFYFAGHGIQRSRNDAVLLFEDFADPNAGGVLTNSADLVNIFNGMAPPPADSPNKIARTQFYFIDACRILPSEIRDFERMSTTDVFDVELSGRDDRQAPIFFATLPGIKAYGVRNEQSLFNKALLECLNGAAGDVYEKPDGDIGYCVTVQSLNKALHRFFDELTELPELDQEFSLGGIATGDAVIQRLDSRPMLDLFLEVEPNEALPFTKIEIVSGDPTVQVAPLPKPLSPVPFKCQVPLGFYTINAITDAGNSAYQTAAGAGRMYLPPRAFWKRSVRK